jgi:hypothetical protein
VTTAQDLISSLSFMNVPNARATNVLCSLRRATGYPKVAERETALVQTSHEKKSATGPVMLDPKGFSPGGTPNWYLNLQRKERAGLK